MAQIGPVRLAYRAQATVPQNLRNGVEFPYRASDCTRRLLSSPTLHCQKAVNKTLRGISCEYEPKASHGEDYIPTQTPPVRLKRCMDCGLTLVASLPMVKSL